jgi:glycosyltransferase involved in cell wall biosynthesis
VLFLAGSTYEIVYLSPTFMHYRVPVFEEMAKLWPGKFKVVALRSPEHREERKALLAGSYPRELVKGRWVRLSKKDLHGLGTPMGLVFGPGVISTLMRLRPRVVIVNNYSLWTMSAMIAKTWGARIVIFSEGTPHTERTVGVNRARLRRWLATKADAFVVNGSLAREYVETLGVESRKIVEGGLGVDVEGISRTAQEVPESWVRSTKREMALVYPTFISVLRLIRGKGLSYLLSALKVLKARSLNFSLLIVGDGPERGVLEEQVQRESLTGVHFVGMVPAESVPRYHRLADVFVLPTLQDNWSLAVVEAMASGLPVVTSIYNGLWPELIREGENGFVVDPKNLDQFANRLAFFCEHWVEKARQMGEVSRELVGGYGPDRVAAAFANAVRIADMS